MTTATMTKPHHAQECAASRMAEIARLYRLFQRCTENGHDAWADDIYDRMLEMPLSVLLQSGWHERGEMPADREYKILLCDGGPAVRIMGDLCSFGEPITATLECQDRGTPWTRAREQDELALLDFARLFIHGTR
jgi:hypothetical protein